MDSRNLKYKRTVLNLLLIQLIQFPMLLAEEVSPTIPGMMRDAPGEYFGQIGNVLLTELSCTACHKSGNDTLQPKGGPVLTGILHRVQPEWIHQFLKNPNTTKPGTTMPDVLDHLPAVQKTKVINGLLAFLGSSKKTKYAPIKEDKNGDPGASNAERGYDLFHSVGCVGCHDPDSSEKFHELNKEDFEDNGVVGAGPLLSEWAESVPLPNLFNKYSHDALTKFLLNPGHVRPAGRMPSLKLNVVEAADIAHYLLGEKTVVTRPPTDAPDQQLVAQGKVHFVKFGCIECHQLEEDFSQIDRPVYRPLAAEMISGGCLEINSARRSIKYPLTSQQQQLLKSAISDQIPETTEQLLHRKLVAGNCYACHQRIWKNSESVGGVGARRFSLFETVGHVDFGDEGRIPPPLSDVGAKLTEAALTDILAGKRDIRPHMQARMPLFTEQVTGGLPTLFKRVDSVENNTTDLFSEIDKKELIEAGRQLVDKGCVQCHAINGKRMTGVVGVEMGQPGERLQAGWFKEFLLDPNSKRPRTRMPNFFPQGNASVPQILNGDIQQQVTAIWTYLNHSKTSELPDKLLADEQQNFELKPNDSPIRLRTFMQNVGTRAMAVGFPQRIHYAYDLKELRLALAWKGRFLDAHGTWFDRFIPFAAPLGDEQITLTQGVALARPGQSWPTKASAAGIRYLGYRLAKPPDTVPTLRFGNDQIEATDTLLPINSGLKRTIVVKGETTGWALLLATARETAKLVGDSDSVVIVDQRLTVTVDSGHLLKMKDGQVYVLLRPGDQSVEVKYQW